MANNFWNIGKKTACVHMDDCRRQMITCMKKCYHANAATCIQDLYDMLGLKYIVLACIWYHIWHLAVSYKCHGYVCVHEVTKWQVWIKENSTFKALKTFTSNEYQWVYLKTQNIDFLYHELFCDWFIVYPFWRQLLHKNAVCIFEVTKETDCTSHMWKTKHWNVFVQMVTDSVTGLFILEMLH